MATEQKANLQEIQNILSVLEPIECGFPTHANTMLDYISQWLGDASRVMDMSRGFEINRCALYWTGYEGQEAFDGQAFVKSCQDSKGSLRQLAQILDTDLQIFELDPENTTQPSADALALACSYGMMAIEESTQLFSACSFGRGTDAAAQKAMAALKNSDSFDFDVFMSRNCGLDHGAILGGAIAGIMKGIPVILEGHAGQLVAHILFKITGCHFGNLLVLNEMPVFAVNPLPGHSMVTTAIILKTLYAGSTKSSCGKIQKAA